MKYVILKHLSGSKANQVERIPLENFKGIIFGRDAEATVKYDADRDDLVGRQHAKISSENDDHSVFSVADLNSRNGTFVNKQRVSGSLRINPGDVVQFGPGGPEFVFDLEPRPANYVPPTREASVHEAFARPTPPPTREASASAPHRITTGLASPVVSTGGQAQKPIGKTTVERLVTQGRNQSKRQMMIGAGVLLVLLLSVGGYFSYRLNRVSAVTGASPTPTPGGLTPQQISQKYENAIALIEASWRLVTLEGRPVYHEYTRLGDKVFAIFVQMPDGTIEPLLTEDEYAEPTLFPGDRERNPMIAGRHKGSGFAVTSNGLILTNRHVAAGWRSYYDFELPKGVRSLWLQSDNRGRISKDSKGGELSPENIPRKWIPDNAHSLGGRGSFEKKFEGENVRLEVSFHDNAQRKTARLATVSDRADLATIKIEIMTPISAVPQLNENYDEISKGATVFVMGYAGVTPPVREVIFSKDALNTETQAREIPNPSINPGVINNIIRDQLLTGAQKPAQSITQGLTISEGDLYQLDINSTGGGNSGGPVFDTYGKVIAVFAAGGSAGGATVTFAVPIRYAKEIM